MTYVLIYVSLVVLVNLAFVWIPPLVLMEGVIFPPAALLVGFVFVARDYAQREVGHWVLVAMLVGALLSYVLADPYVAVASAVAFTVSEVVDWIVYSLTRRPFRERVLLSSLIGTPIDSALFLIMIGAFGWFTLIIMVMAKMVAVMTVVVSGAEERFR